MNDCDKCDRINFCPGLMSCQGFSMDWKENLYKFKDDDTGKGFTIEGFVDKKHDDVKLDLKPPGLRPGDKLWAEYDPFFNKCGKKYDDGKPDWHCVPLEVIELLVPVFEAGIKKGYGRFNCLEKFVDADRRFYSGKMRHTKACQMDPLAKDEETGCFHEAQAAFNSLMRLYHAKKEKENV